MGCLQNLYILFMMYFLIRIASEVANKFVMSCMKIVFVCNKVILIGGPSWKLLKSLVTSALFLK